MNILNQDQPVIRTTSAKIPQQRTINTTGAGSMPQINISESKVYFASTSFADNEAESFTKEERKKINESLWKSKTAQQF